MTNPPDASELHKLLRGGNRYVFKKGQVVESSDGRLLLALIDRGYIKRYQIVSDGSIGIHGIYGPDNFFPLTLAFELLFTHTQDLYTGPETFYYETMSDTTIYAIDNATFIASIEQDPLLYRDLLVEAGKRLHFYIQRLENYALKGAHKRVAHQLVFYTKVFGRPHGGSSVEIELPLTHQILADILSLTRETVSQSFSVLRQEGLIDSSSKIVVLDVEKLDKFARA